MAISPVLQQISVIQDAAEAAAEMLSRPIRDIVVTDDTIRVVAGDESIAFGISHPGALYDPDGHPMVGGSMPKLIENAQVQITGRRKRRRVPGAAISLKRSIMLRGAIEYAAHRGDFPIAAIRVRTPFFKVTCGARTRWLLCTHARRVPHPPYGAYDRTTFVPLGPGPIARLRSLLGRPR